MADLAAERLAARIAAAKAEQAHAEAERALNWAKQVHTRTAREFEETKALFYKLEAE